MCLVYVSMVVLGWYMFYLGFKLKNVMFGVYVVFGVCVHGSVVFGICVCVTVLFSIYIEECLLRDFFSFFVFLWLLQVCTKAAKPVIRIGDSTQAYSFATRMPHEHNILIDAGKYVSTFKFPYVICTAIILILLLYFFTSSPREFVNAQSQYPYNGCML